MDGGEDFFKKAFFSSWAGEFLGKASFVSGKINHSILFDDFSLPMNLFREDSRKPLQYCDKKL